VKQLKIQTTTLNEQFAEANKSDTEETPWTAGKVERALWTRVVLPEVEQSNEATKLVSKRTHKSDIIKSDSFIVKEGNNS